MTDFHGDKLEMNLLYTACIFHTWWEKGKERRFYS